MITYSKDKIKYQKIIKNFIKTLFTTLESVDTNFKNGATTACTPLSNTGAGDSCCWLCFIKK